MIKVGDKIPDVTLSIATAEGPQNTTTAEMFAGKKVVLFALPGAFTPTCSAAHLPGYVVAADDIFVKDHLMSCTDEEILTTTSQMMMMTTFLSYHRHHFLTLEQQ